MLRCFPADFCRPAQTPSQGASASRGARGTLRPWRGVRLARFRLSYGQNRGLQSGAPRRIDIAPVSAALVISFRRCAALGGATLRVATRATGDVRAANLPGRPRRGRRGAPQVSRHRIGPGPPRRSDQRQSRRGCTGGSRRTDFLPRSTTYTSPLQAAIPLPTCTRDRLRASVVRAAKRAPHSLLGFENGTSRRSSAANSSTRRAADLRIRQV